MLLHLWFVSTSTLAWFVYKINYKIAFFIISFSITSLN